MEHEHESVVLHDGKGHALLSGADTVDTAIVYVHGFLGDPVDTWRDIVYFVDRLPGAPFAHCDLYFVNYGAEEDFVIASANTIRRFIEHIFPTPPESYFRYAMREVDWRLKDNADQVVVVREPGSYRRLILVGHSLGTVVIRRLIADAAYYLDGTQAADATDTIILKSDVRLFAPAHLGYRPLGLKRILASPACLGALLCAPSGVLRAIADLKENCHTLVQLREETESYAQRFPNVGSLHPHIIFGKKENIVVYGRYNTDPPKRFREVPGLDHTEICKISDIHQEAAYLVTEGKAESA